MNNLPELLCFARETAAAASEVVLGYFRSCDFAVEEKSDRTPVTSADIAAEKQIRAAIRKTYPSHGIIGEEMENVSPESELQWTIDPIDGTQSFVQGIPTFGTLLGLRSHGEAVLGVIINPALSLELAGARGQGVTYNGRELLPRPWKTRPELRENVIATGTRSVFERSSDGAFFETVHRAFPHSRIFYDCYAHSLCLTGCLAAAVEPNLQTWDITPAEALVRELGGKLTQLSMAKNCVSVVFGDAAMVDHVAALQMRP